MSAESLTWLRYAEENLQVARLCLENGLFNPSIQNSQQAAEKALKAWCAAAAIPPRKTHSTSGLRSDLREAGVDCGMTDEDCELLDAVYLPSKYPLGSVLPDFEPDERVARRCLDIAGSTVNRARQQIA